MARGTSQKTRRARTQTIQGDTTRIERATPITAQAGSKGADAAFALADALKGGMALQERRDTDKGKQAKADFQRGAINADEKNGAYRRTITSLRAKARWIEDEAEFDEAFEDVDKENLTLDDINAALDEIFAAKYGDLDDPQVASEVVPKMQEYREKKIAEVLEIQDAAEVAEAGAAMTTIAEDAYRRGQNEDGTFEFDYEGLNSQVQGFLKGAPGNSTMFEIIKDIAIRNGDVAFLRGVPERWSDGTPTFMSDPAYNEKVLNAENRAIQEAMRIEKAEQEQLDDALKEQHRVLTVTAAIKAVNGVAMDDEIMQLLTNPNTDATDITGLYAAHRAGLTESERRSWDERTVTRVWAGITAGQVDVAAIVDMHDAGLLGTGPQSAKLAESMIRMADMQARAADSDTTATFQNFRTLINKRYNPQTDGPLGPVQPDMNAINVQANEMFLTLLAENPGMTPAAGLRQSCRADGSRS